MASDHDVTNHPPHNKNSSTTRDRNTRNPHPHSTSSSSQTSSSDQRHSDSNPASKHANIIYTPASTVTSSKGSSACDDIVADTLEAAGWPEEWCQLRTFASDIGQIKQLLSRQSSDTDDANDLSRLKQNHRSSLASLAEMHRTEIASLNSAHSEAMRKLELQHLQELKDARRNHGHDRDLVRGLHESYGKQIESLVLDLGEARREIQELKLSHPAAGATSVAETEANAETERQTRRLAVRLKFDELEEALGTTELWVPHPGKSFDRLLEAVTCAAIQHLAAVKQTANFFLYRLFRDEHRDAALNINKWTMAVDSDKIRLEFTSPSRVNVKWEEEEWTKEDLVLDVRCHYENSEARHSDIQGSPYEDGYERGESRDDGRTSSMASSSTTSLIDRRSDGSGKDTSTPTNRRERYTAKDLLEQLEPAEMQHPPHNMTHIEAEFNSFGPAAHHHHLASESEADPVPNSEDDKENQDPRKPVRVPKLTGRPPRVPPKVTMEEIRDEDAPPSPIRVAPTAKVVPILSVPQPKRRAASPLKGEVGRDDGAPLQWEQPRPQPKVRPPTLTKESTALLTELLEEHSRESQNGSRMGQSMTDSFLTEDLFASPGDSGVNSKPDGGNAEVPDQSEPAPMLQSALGDRQTGFSPLLGAMPSSSRDPLIGNNRAMNEQKWRPMAVADRKPTPFAPRKDDNTCAPPKSFFSNGLSSELPYVPPSCSPSEFLSDNEGDDEETSQADTEVRHSTRGVTPTIGHMNGSTPPPAPEVSRQDTPTIPEYTSGDMSEFNFDNSADDEGASPSTQAHSRNPFSNAHSTDMPASPSSASEAPLLNQGGSSRKNNHQPHHHRGLTNNTHTTNESRGPPPPAPCANYSPEQRNSSRAKRSPRRYEPTETAPSMAYNGEGWDSCGSHQEYGPEYMPAGMPYLGNPPAPYHDHSGVPSSHSGSDSSSEYDYENPQAHFHGHFPHGAPRQIIPMPNRSHTFPAGQFPFPTDQAKMIHYSFQQQYFRNLGIPPPRSSTAPSFNPGATVFPPNPPLALTQRPSLQQLNAPPYPTENGGPVPQNFPWNNHPMLSRPPGQPQRGYSSDALVWTNEMPGMPHGPSPSSSNPEPPFNGMMPPGWGMGIQGSPGSAQSGMHPPQAIPPAWYGQPRPMPSQENFQWTGSPMSMGIPGWSQYSA